MANLWMSEKPFLNGTAALTSIPGTARSLSTNLNLPNFAASNRGDIPLAFSLLAY